MIKTPKLIAYYPFETDAKDYSGNGLDLTLGGGGALPTLGAGLLGNGYTFDGNDTMAINSSAFSFINGATNDLPFSISFRMKATTFDNFYVHRIAAKGNLTDREWTIQCEPVNYITTNLTCYCLATGSGSNWIGRYAPVTKDVVYHVVFTYDGSKSVGGVKIYLNGVRSDTTNVTAGSYGGMTNANGIVSIGYRGGSNDRYFKGLLDDFAFFKNVALSESDVRRLMVGLHPLNG